MKFTQKLNILRKSTYAEDGIVTTHLCDFRDEEKFKQARDNSVNICGEGRGLDWRLHTALWVAEQCLKLDGDFVECGVNHGFLARAMLEYMEIKRPFYLLDTFEGIPFEQISQAELLENRNHAQYTGTYENILRVFKGFDNIKIIKGKVPDTLDQVKSEKIAYLSLDMNLAYPEIKAIEFFWDKMVSGGMILLDDYAYERSYRKQRIEFDKWAKENNTRVLTLATGQGLIIKR